MSRPIASHPDASLALAIVAPSTTRLLLLDGDLNVLAASASFGRDFQSDLSIAPGASLFALSGGEWDTPKVRSFLRATASATIAIDAYELDLDTAKGRRNLILSANTLAYDDREQVRILLSIADVTDARRAEKLKDDLLHEKNILLQEVQHRVANSLQIIASVIMQSAKRVQSEETRTHLQDAHLRVMSVAQLQRQLSQSTLGDVAMRTYLTDLCASISASMIRDPGRISVAVTADESVATADASISLGLIVTELVINALKHAFPAPRAGKIVVHYERRGADWRLYVQDDGIGMPSDPDHIKQGLGTSVVTALANQLSATIDIRDNKPGTTVSLDHVEIAAPEASQA